jgi:thioester reductase-like protein
VIGLLVGYPSLVSRALAEELLRGDGEARLAMLVPEGLALAGSRASWPLADIGRVELIEGDGSAIDFGLSGADYARLADSIDFAVIAGMTADPTAGEAAARRNIGLAREVVEIAQAARGLKRVLWLSNLCVAGRVTDVFHERDLNVGQGFDSEVEKSVATAERMLERIAPNVGVTVLRTGHFTCRTDSGEVDRESVLFALSRTLLDLAPHAPLPRPIHADRRVPLVAVDYVASIAVELLLEQDVSNRTLHLLDEGCPTLLELMELVASQSGRRLERDPEAPAEHLLFTLNTLVSKRHVRSLLDAVGSRAAFDDTRVRALDTRVAHRSFSDYAERWMKSMLEEARQATP